jgi:hypothetical protein
VNIYRYGKVIKVTKKKYKEIPYVTILSNRKCNFFFFYKIGEQEGGTGLAWGC